MNRTITALAVFIVAAASMDSAFAADARKGETLAKRWCATCHVVASDQKRANGQAPPFSSVGKMP
ncbi:MAG TPA: cytochrome c, partial [Pseudolabrys sp.]|nr:cytochrome c [Pseudolabrys sp.]